MTIIIKIIKKNKFCADVKLMCCNEKCKYLNCTKKIDLFFKMNIECLHRFFFSIFLIVFTFIVII